MRVLVDTNVLLSGALFRRGYAGHLPTVAGAATFLVPAYCLAECRAVLRRHAPTPAVAEGAFQAVERFVQQLRAVVVPDRLHAPRGLPDPKDEPVLDGALASDCDAVCTYNTRDLRPGGLPVLSPLGVLRRRGPPDAAHLSIQYPVLTERGTLLFLGRLHHESSLGEVLVTANGTHVFTDGQGFIRVEGPDVTHVTARAPLLGQQVLAFVFRYRPQSDFEAVMWLPVPRDQFQRPGQQYERVLLTRGRARFTPPITPKLVYDGNFGFFAWTLHLSGVPVYLRDADVPFVIENGCLEALVGSPSVRDLLRACTVIRLPDGSEYFGIG